MNTFTVQDPETKTYRAATLYVCGKCGRTADELHVRDWLIAPRVDTAEARAEGWMVIRCPQHTTAYARRIAGLPQTDAALHAAYNELAAGMTYYRFARIVRLTAMPPAEVAAFIDAFLDQDDHQPWLDRANTRDVAAWVLAGSR